MNMDGEEYIGGKKCEVKVELFAVGRYRIKVRMGDRQYHKVLDCVSEEECYEKGKEMLERQIRRDYGRNTD